MSELVLMQHKDSIIDLTLNRANKRNAINPAMMDALSAAFDQVETMTGARVILLRAKGPGFSSGIDLMAMDEIGERFGEGWRDNLFAMTAAYQGVLNKIERSTLPVIALLHGHCMGLGMELALACDMRIAAEGTRLSLPEARLGIIPDVGGTTRLTQLLGPARAKEFIITGRTFNLADAERWGLVNYVVPENELESKAHSLAEEIKRAAPLAVNYARRVINDMQDTAAGLQLEAWAQSVLIRSEDFERGAQAMLLKQQAEWTGK